MDKQQIWTIFLLQFNLGQNITGTARHVVNAFGPKIFIERTAQRL